MIRQGDGGDPAPVAVTPEMVAAGLERAKELADEPDKAYVVEAIYLAMENQRLDSDGKLLGLFNYSLKLAER
jgi:hypothetical protein